MWSWEQIEREWLRGGRIAVPTDAAVAAFNRVESLLGSDWIKERGGSPEKGYGPAPTMGVVGMGQRLAVLDGVRNTDSLLDKIRRGDHSASAELTAIYLIRSGRPEVGVELEPEVAVGHRRKKPDFLLSLPGEASTYLEVTQPNLSEEQNAVEKTIKQITGVIQGIKSGFALEVFLRRMPTAAEVAVIESQLPALCIRDGIHREELGDLGFLLLNLDPPGHFEFRSHDGEESRPRLSVIQTIFGPKEPRRHIVVRLAFSDGRAQQFLESEAKQLPKDASGLIMIEMAHASGGFRTWEATLRRRLQPTLHTRVSALCLFHSGLQGTEDGEAWIPRTKLILNPYATYPLPNWISQQLGRYASDW